MPRSSNELKGFPTICVLKIGWRHGGVQSSRTKASNGDPEVRACITFLGKS